jgi:hypothetical protein
VIVITWIVLAGGQLMLIEVREGLQMIRLAGVVVRTRERPKEGLFVVILKGDEVFGRQLALNLDSPVERDGRSSREQ